MMTGPWGQLEEAPPVTSLSPRWTGVVGGGDHPTRAQEVKKRGLTHRGMGSWRRRFSLSLSVFFSRESSTAMAAVRRSSCHVLFSWLGGELGRDHPSPKALVVILGFDCIIYFATLRRTPSSTASIAGLPMMRPPLCI